MEYSPAGVRRVSSVRFGAKWLVSRPMNSRSLIVYRGRAGDRNTRGTAGAQMLGALLARRYGLDTTFVSTPQAPLPTTAWDEQLARRARRSACVRGRAARIAERRDIAPSSPWAAARRGSPPSPWSRERHPDACVVWFDAHGDSNLPSSNAVPYLGGMVLTGAAGHWDSGLGAGLNLSNVVLVGARDLDPHEKELIAAGQLKVVEVGPKPCRAAGRRGRQRATSMCTSTATCSSPASCPSNTRCRAASRSKICAPAPSGSRERKIIGVEIAEFESEWLDGRPASPDRLVDAIAPLLGGVVTTQRRNTV